MDSTLVYIHPTVLFTIIDSFERRKEDAKRVIGTLLGMYSKYSLIISIITFNIVTPNFR